MTDDESRTSEPFAGLRSDLKELLHEEVAQLRAEVSDSASRTRNAALLLAAAGLLGGLAAGTSAAAVTRVFDQVMPKPMGALATTALFGVGAAVTARLALAEARRARQALPASL